MLFDFVAFAGNDVSPRCIAEQQGEIVEQIVNSTAFQAIVSIIDAPLAAAGLPTITADGFEKVVDDFSKNIYKFEEVKDLTRKCGWVPCTALNTYI